MLWNYILFFVVERDSNVRLSLEIHIFYAKHHLPNLFIFIDSLYCAYLSDPTQAAG